MDKEEIFADAKRSIFGEPPSCKFAQVGYNMAMNYYGGIIPEAEKALASPYTAPAHITLILRNAFEFSSYDAIQVLPEKTLSSLKTCAENFHNRYRPLVEALEARVA